MAQHNKLKEIESKQVPPYEFNTFCLIIAFIKPVSALNTPKEKPDIYL